MNTAVTGLIFDLDNTLLDRNATFFKVAESFYAEHLSGKTSVTREDAVAAMVRWDEDGYTNRATMLERWVTEWPETGLDVEAVIEWYRAAMARHVEPDHKVNDFLAWLNERGVPWGIVTNGSSNQHVKCRVSGTGSARTVHHCFGRGGLRQAGPQDISRCSASYRYQKAQSGHVRRRQSHSRH